MALQVNQAMREQEGAARMMSSAAESARSMSEKIRDATIAEARHSDRIVESIEELKKASETGLNAFAKLDEMVRRVNNSTTELNTHLKRFKT